MYVKVGKLCHNIKFYATKLHKNLDILWHSDEKKLATTSLF